ncbi:MAG: hypothetical protein RBR25_01420 [Trichloromonas sp.]|nr:hypothetical protein [Trichloromonas sp.]
MTSRKSKVEPGTLSHYLLAVKDGTRRFENAFQGVARMILEKPIEKVVVNGKTTYDFQIFREGRKHVIDNDIARKFTA